MKFSFRVTKAQIRVFSAICSNLVVVWLGAMFITKDIFALIINLLYASICWKLAVRSEELLEEL